MRALDVLPPPGCSLSQEELAQQRGRARRLAPAVADVVREDDAVHVTFSENADRALLDELVSTERSCCTFLEIAYDEPTRRLSVAASDAQGREVVSRLYAFFAREGGA